MHKQCPSGKKQFASPQAAHEHNKHLRSNGPHRRAKRKKANGAVGKPGAYRCDECKLWHVSSYTS